MKQRWQSPKVGVVLAVTAALAGGMLFSSPVSASTHATADRASSVTPRLTGGGGAWNAHLPGAMSNTGSAEQVGEPTHNFTPIPSYMWQGVTGSSYNFFNTNPYTGWNICNMDSSGGSNYACPKFSSANDASLQRILGTIYGGYQITVYSSFPEGSGNAQIGDGSQGMVLGYMTAVGAWSMAKVFDAHVQSDMTSLQNWVRANEKNVGTCGTDYAAGENLNLKIACVAYWELETFDSLYQEIYWTPDLCADYTNIKYTNPVAFPTIAQCMANTQLGPDPYGIMTDVAARLMGSDMTQIDPTPNAVGHSGNSNWWGWWDANAQSICRLDLTSLNEAAAAYAAVLGSSAWAPVPAGEVDDSWWNSTIPQDVGNVMASDFNTYFTGLAGNPANCPTA